MTINSTTRKAGPFIGNGSAASFPFNFKVFQASDLDVVKLNTSTNAEQTLVLTADYTVTLNQDQDSNPGGTVILTAGALPSGFTLTMTSDVANLQPTDLTNQGGFYPEVINDSLDRATIQIQQLQEQVDRSIKLPLSSTANSELPFPDPSKLLGWNSNGSALTNFDPASVVSVVGQQNSYADIFTGNGVTTNFTLTRDPGSVFNIDVSIQGVTQAPNVDYILNGTVLSFTTAPPAVNSRILARYSEVYGFSTGDAVNVRYVPAGPGAVTTNVQAKLRETVSVKDFGAVCDGVTDDSAAVQAAIDAAAPGSQILLLDNVKLGSTIIINKPLHIFGGGARQGTQVYAPGVTAFDIFAAGTKISGFRLYGDRTVGSTGIVISGAPKVIIEDMDIELFGIGIHQKISGFHVSLNSLRMRNMTTTVVWLEDGVGTRLKDVVYDTDVDTYPQPTVAGIHIQQEGTQLDLCDFIRAYRGLFIECGPHRNIEWVLANNCYFDTCGVKSNGRGVHIRNNQPTRYIRGLWFNQVWTATCGIGYLIDGTGVIDGVHLDACPIHNNNNEGVRADGPQIRNLRIRDCDLIGNNSSSVTLPNENAANVSLNVPWVVEIKNSHLGQGLNWAAVPTTQLFMNTNQGDVVFAGNTVDTVVSSGVPFINISSNTIWFTEPNYGMLTEYTGGVTFGAGDTVKTVTHNLGLAPDINEIQLTPTTGWANTTVWWVTNVTPTTFDVRVDPAPGAAISYNWHAKIFSR